MTGPPRGLRVVYVSPLKALAVDIHQNLERPLAEIAGIAAELGEAPSAHHRGGAHRRHPRRRPGRHGQARPPTFLVTTPESLYLLVTAERRAAPCWPPSRR